MFSASRNSVSSSSVVGNTLNSTGRVMYIATSSTMTDNMMFGAISTSRSNAGSGAIIASTMPSTPIGTAMSGQGSAPRP